MHRVIVPIASAAMVLAATQASWGLINPKFTPQYLVDQSETILVVKLNAPVDGKVTAEIIRASLPKILSARIQGKAQREREWLGLAGSARGGPFRASCTVGRDGILAWAQSICGAPRQRGFWPTGQAALV